MAKKTSTAELEERLAIVEEMVLYGDSRPKIVCFKNLESFRSNRGRIHKKIMGTYQRI